MQKRPVLARMCGCLLLEQGAEITCSSTSTFRAFFLRNTWDTSCCRFWLEKWVFAGLSGDPVQIDRSYYNVQYIFRQTCHIIVLISRLKWKKDPVCAASEYCKTTYDMEGVAPCSTHSDCDKIWECDNLCSVFGRLWMTNNTRFCLFFSHKNNTAITTHLFGCNYCLRKIIFFSFCSLRNLTRNPSGHNLLHGDAVRSLTRHSPCNCVWHHMHVGAQTAAND